MSTHEGEHTGGSGADVSPRRGRPPGSVKLTPEVERTILAYTEAGAADYIAAEAAGVEARTFRDWVARGEDRHPTRSATPQLKAFAKAVREARARARVSKEVIVAEKDPRFWLKHMARSKPDREGWTDPVQGEGANGSHPTAPYAPTLEEISETVRILLDAGAITVPCADPYCRCPNHTRQPPDA